MEDQYDGRAGCHLEYNSSALRDRSLVLQCANMTSVTSVRHETIPSSAHPLRLVRLPLLRHLITDAIRIPKRPYGQLMKNAKLEEDIELGKFIGNLIVPERVREMRCFGIILTSRVFVEIVESEDGRSC